MKNNDPGYTSIDQYIASQPQAIQQILTSLRTAIHEAAPQASEKISYQMPTFFLHGNLVHFAAYKNHIGFYPAPSGIRAFAAELSAFHTSKGAVQFPIDQPLPLELVQRIVKFRVAENLEIAELKKTRKRKP